jgi:Recombinase
MPHLRTRRWTQDTVAGILRNVAYAGLTYVNRKRREGPLLRGNWPEMIDRTTWDIVQRRIATFRTWVGGRKPPSEQRGYAFQGLLRCEMCGNRMHCHWIKKARYQCRGGDLAQPCRRMVPEDVLLPWAERLFTVLDAYRGPGGRPENFRELVAEELAGQGSVQHSPDALRQLDSRKKRAEQLFLLGHWTTEQLTAETASIATLRAEIERELEQPNPALLWPVGSLLEIWERGEPDPKIRRDLLAEFFDELAVRNEEVVGVTPRGDRTAEVTALLENAYTQFSSGDPGGIRTRDLSLERAASWSTRRRGHGGRWILA